MSYVRGVWHWLLRDLDGISVLGRIQSGDRFSLFAFSLKA
jgi:hypothetical protein